jgi:hypothetical protein
VVDSHILAVGLFCVARGRTCAPIIRKLMKERPTLSLLPTQAGNKSFMMGEEPMVRGQHGKAARSWTTQATSLTAAVHGGNTVGAAEVDTVLRKNVAPTPL